MDKNTIIGFILIAAIVIGFSIYNAPTEEERAKIEQQRRYNDSIQQVQAEQAAQAAQQAAAEDSVSAEAPETPETNPAQNFFEPAQLSQDSIGTATSDTAAISTAETVSLENELLKLDISTKGAQIVSAQLKGYHTYIGDSLYLFNNDAQFSLELENKASAKLHTQDLFFTPVKADSTTLIMRMNYSPDKYIDFIYSLEPNSYMLNFDIQAVGMQDVLSRTSKNEFVFTWAQGLRRQEKSIENEQRYSRIYYKQAGQTVEELSESADVKEEVSVPVKWVAFKDQFFASTLIADDNFSIAVLNSKIITGSPDYLKHYSATLYTAPKESDDGTLHTGFRYFLGPLKYSMLKDYDDGQEDVSQLLELDKLVPLGWALFRWVNQYFIIPLFNLLNKTGWGLGIIILLLTIIVKIIIAPLTYKSYMSSAKMRVLRPQVEEINAKYPKQEQAMERQRATMDLYSKAGASPMSGCIPMLLQFPVLAALFMFFPSAIELRGQSFLWADDLSTYDAIFEWKANIPLLSSWLGNHLSLFCVLMTITNIIYTKFNMDATNTGQQQMPGMKWLMMLMPVIFLFVLNNYPSGLTYYYFLSFLITILLTLGFRYTIDEEALLKKLEENKKKPKKKSGFMARLEEAQRYQQQQAKANAKRKR
ncbi:MAG: membrane protein insertase YidC [Prevotella sp.]|jgi:YidC/Oxa1 family membrane protein insertase|nr:membrane protein insertase YidC [Prevotella sp.]